jgi:RNA polymerase sigma factor (TIGR02999 family)
MDDATRLLNAMGTGDPHASAELLPVVYQKLRQLARARISNERVGHTLEATALVHEAYLRLMDDPDRRWNNRGHFFAAAAEAMRRILVESARRKKRVRHGGQLERVDFDEQLQVSADQDVQDVDLLALDELLNTLETEEPEVAEVIKLRYFAGLTIEETAEALQLSVRTVNRHWAFGRAWLFRQLR